MKTFLRFGQLRILLVAAFALFSLLLSPPARGQFLGYTAPQTVQQKLFSGQMTSATTPVFTLNCTPTNGNPCGIQNVGQSIHQLTFTTSGGSCSASTSIDIRIEATYDGSTWFPISEDSQDSTNSTGSIYAYGSFPGIRANLVSGASATCAVTVLYAGTWSGQTTDQGIFNASQKQTKVVMNALPANAAQSNYIYPPFGNTSGLLTFNTSGTLPAGTCTLTVQAQPASGGFGYSTIFTVTLPAGGGPVPYVVGSAPANKLLVSFASCGATATTVTLTYLFNASPLPVATAASLVGTVSSAGNDYPFMGPLLVEKSGRWSQISNPVAGSQGSASRAAASTTGVRHVADCATFSAGSTTAPALTALTVNLRDGATGAGTILRTWQLVIPATTGQDVPPIEICGLGLIGSANTAMTLEFSAGLANLIESVSLTGYDIL